MSVLFFVVFIILQQFIMLNLFIFVLMKSFEENYINLDNPIQNFSDLTEQFKEKWSQYCSKQHIFYIHKTDMIEFMIFMDKPLGLGFKPHKENAAIIEQLKLEKKTYYIFKAE